MKRHYPIELIEEQKRTVYFPVEFSNIPVSRIAFGTISVEASCSPHPDKKNVIAISQDLVEELKFPLLNVPLHIFQEEQTLHIGPLVGIFTAGFTPFPIRPIGERTLFFSKLLSVKKTVGALPFVFGEQHINWDQGTIEGLFYNENGWEKIEVPFPNVIYDRLPNRKSERKTEMNKIKERLQTEYLIPWYNPGFFNKLDIYERLQQHQEVASYLPETHPFTSFSVIERMLSDYGHVYMKPINGSLGLGIHQIIYDKKEGDYYCRYRDRTGENRLRKFQTLESLFHHVFQNRKLENMLVQQGIHLMRVDKRLVDFRIHTNKDELGEWHVTALAAKVAGSGSVTTHVSNGGSIKTIEELFTDNSQEITNKLTKAALEMSQILEHQMEGIIGEIGFDLGMDRKGNVWFFEANSKPGRSIFKHPQLKEFDLLTRKLSLAFAVFLTERAIKEPGEIFK
ncbi:YheC/YheD family protein [Bacillus sp. 31A1R]|uniref:YheC/YheD family protein n=1 Tax=Robertmurraya mangrovi TaxID=3098077 RepID=A0ABU5ISS0_9BACI|nr:YheC/YheD family protein [Bacillus sp. 31A1R]MDZ5470178.1 YheC/YheD family protein [Bacillus sp. 31A1R]